MGGFEWDCSNCTFRHHVPAPRCQMCGELRVTRKQMRDFATRGVPVTMTTTTQQEQRSSENSTDSGDNDAATNKRRKTTTNLSQTTIFSTALALAQPKKQPPPPSSSSASSSATSNNNNNAAAAKQQPPPVAAAAAPRQSTAAAAVSATAAPRQSSSTAAANTKRPSTAPNNATTINNPYSKFRPTSASGAATGQQQQQQQQQQACSNRGPPLASSSLQLPSATRPRNAPAAAGPRMQQQQQQQPSFQQRGNGTAVAGASPTGPSQQLNNHYRNNPPPPRLQQQQYQQQQQQKRYQQFDENPNQRQQQPHGGKINATTSDRRLQSHLPLPFQMQPPRPKPPPGAAVPPYAAGPVPHNSATIGNWIYPQNPKHPIRSYQLEMTETALFHNTLVSLPTGLGKTLIAAVVLYNYNRWFPTGKVIFLAPTLPLVDQQVEACYKIMGIAVSATGKLTGHCAAPERERIWREKQVFFCTPQTLQRDIETGRCPVSQIVCLVLDEAHKASGEYAYCKVVQYMEEAQAKARVVGLSATPGADIKKIQKVVDALRINRIEHRSEDDPSVARYTFARETENVIVPQTSIAKTIERCLTDIISPLIETLRRANVLPDRYGTAATIAGWSLLKAKNEYCQREERNANGELQGCFAAAQRFAQIRDHLHSHGLGVVRTKVIELRNQPQRGKLSTIVKTDPKFDKLWGVVGGATGCTQGDAQECLANNPKLLKLKEIMIEHFERARACAEDPARAAGSVMNDGTGETSSKRHGSTRAIVFSQFRESVSEICSVLRSCEPLIRPRHFIGQGKGSKKKAEATEGSATGEQLSGMKQKEQFEVIREFRANIYNVLVCTCIGEEGLDIGEVDLIVCFDTLGNPIRSIQRVGRTGRKRNGRVVCLVSEGKEEKKMKNSKSQERTLHHSLKDPKSYNFLPTVPLLPTQPTRLDKEMIMSQNFHMSQVEGARRNGGTGTANRSLSSSRWRLTEAEESERLEVLGRYSTLRLHCCASSLRRRLVLGRTMRLSKFDGEEVSGNDTGTSHRRMPALGRTAQLLRRFEALYPAPSKSTSTNTSTIVKRIRRGRRDDVTLDLLFPLVPVSDSLLDIGGVNEKTKIAAKGRSSLLAKNPVVRQPLQASACDEKINSPAAGDREAGSMHSTDGDLRHNAKSLSSGISMKQNPGQRVEGNHNEPTIDQTSSAPAAERAHGQSPSNKKKQQVLAASFNPYARKEESRACQRQHEQCDVGVEGRRTGAGAGLVEQPLIAAATDNTTTIRAQIDPVADVISSRKSESDFALAGDLEEPVGIEIPSASDDFVLPTPPDSSSSSEDEADSVDGDDGNDVSEKKGSVLVDVSNISIPVQQNGKSGSKGGLGDDFSLPTQNSDDDSETHETKGDGACGMINVPTTGNENEEPPQEAHDDDFFLPTQESSSSDEESEAEEADENQNAQGFHEQMRDERDTVNQASDSTMSRLASDVAVEASKEDEEAKPLDALNENADVSDERPEPERESIKCQQDVPDVPIREIIAKEDTPISGPADDNRKRCPRRRIEETPASAEAPSQRRTSLVRSSFGGLSGAGSCSTQLSEPPVNRVSKRKVLAVDDTQASNETWTAPKPRPRCANSLAIEDTPASFEQSTKKPRPSFDSLLADTQASEGKAVDNADDIVCAVCGSGESIDVDPIILCDGPGNGIECEISVHMSCYNGNLALPEADEEWRCDPCAFRHEGRAGVVKCGACGREDGALKRVGDMHWKHVRGCSSTNGEGEKRRLKRLRKPHKENKADEGDGAKKRRHLPEGEASDQQREHLEEEQPAARRNKLPRSKYHRFIDYEAGIDSEDDMAGDDEEDAIAAIEEEEDAFENGFINDSSQLGYSQDELDRVDPGASIAAGYSEHQALDRERNRAHEFATPALNRRVLRRKKQKEQKRGGDAAASPSQMTDGTPASAPSSEKGLGNMHFIRSVLEHHRRGGDAEDIEQAYKQLEGEDAAGDSSADEGWR